MKKNLIKIQTNNLFSSSPLFTGKVSEKQHPAEPQAVWCWAAAQPAFFTLEANGVCTPKAADRDCLEKHDEGWLSAQSCDSSEGGQWLTPKVVVDVAAVRTESPALRRGVWCSKSGPSALPRSSWGLSLPLEAQSTPKRSQMHAGPGQEAEALLLASPDVRAVPRLCCSHSPPTASLLLTQSFTYFIHIWKDRAQLKTWKMGSVCFFLLQGAPASVFADDSIQKCLWLG